jgi:hypothetical protein
MIYKLIIKEDAYGDLREAYDYYEEKSQGLGDRFVEEVKQKLTYIQIPFTFPKS